MQISPDIRFTPEYAMTDCDAAERYVFYVTCFTINNVFHSLFCILLHVIMLLIVLWHLRDALLNCYPEVTHLMCNFHVVKTARKS
jgi:hypothetical protein